MNSVSDMLAEFFLFFLDIKYKTVYNMQSQEINHI